MFPSLLQLIRFYALRFARRGSQDRFAIAWRNI
jgi:hypothetical protein